MPETTKRLIEERWGNVPYNKYIERLAKIRRDVQDLWVNKRYTPEYFTFHDGSHSAEVERSIYKLIPPESITRLSDQNLFCLIAAAWLHDVGMIPDSDTHKLSKKINSKSLIGEAINNKYPGQLEKYKNFLLSDEGNTYREFHNYLSKKYVKENFVELGLKAEEAGVIGELCQYHRKSEDISALNNNRDIQLLAAYLRLADAIHINPNRVDKDLLTLFERIGMPSESVLHWLKNLCTAEIRVDNKNQLIVIRINADKDTGPKDIQLMADYIRKEVESELLSVKDILARGNISYYSEVKSELVPAAFTPRDKILVDQIISKLQLTEKSSASDVMDGVFKSIIYILDAQEDDRKKYLMIKWYQENVIGELLAKRPCHILVRRIHKLIQDELKQDEVTQDTALNGVLASIKQKIEDFKNERESRLDKLFKYTNSILSDTGTILLFGHSKLVIRALKSIEPELKAKTTIYVCEARNIGRYNSLNEMDYCDGVEYASSIVSPELETSMVSADEGGDFKKVILVPDIIVASLMSRNLIDKVIFGANGVDMEDGTFGHSAGHLTIADLAYLYSVPVYVILDSFKFGDLKDCFNPDLERNEKDKKNEWLSADKKVLSKLSKVDYYNPREDLIRNELNGRRLKRFTALITDHGIIQANRIPKEIIEIDKLNSCKKD